MPNDETALESEECLLDIVARAAKKWRRMLGEYEAPSIDSGADEALLDVVARKKAATADLARI